MIKGKENLIEFIKLNKTPYWMLRFSKKSEPIFMTRETVKRSMNNSIQFLNSCLSVLSPGTYFIEAWKKPGQKKFRCQDTVEI